MMLMMMVLLLMIIRKRPGPNCDDGWIMLCIGVGRGSVNKGDGGQMDTEYAAVWGL